MLLKDYCYKFSFSLFYLMASVLVGLDRSGQAGWMELWKSVIRAKARKCWRTPKNFAEYKDLKS
jgi:hypothetical protein